MEMTGYSCEKEDGIVILTFRRPDRLNAISTEMGRSLCQLFEQLEGDTETKVVILTGAKRLDGRPCFSAGRDLKEVAETGIPMSSGKMRTQIMTVEGIYKDGGLEELSIMGKLTEMIENLGKPVIAAIDGICTAGGIEIALACDLCLVAETAQISDMHIKNIGGIGGAGATIRLPRVVGPRIAKEMIFTGDVIDGKRAYEIGFANRVCASESLLHEAKALARKIASMRPDAIRLAKANVNAASDMRLRDALRYSYLTNNFLGSTAKEWVEGKQKREKPIQ